MALGQAAFSVAADVAALDALAEELAEQELARGAAHVRLLRTLLRLHAVGRSAGMELSTVPHAALALGCSEHRAGRLLTEALGLGELPGGLEAVECGLLTVEQSSTVVELLAPLPFPVRRAVWARLQQRLIGTSSVLPPARLAELLRRWVQQADPATASDRRREAQDGRRIEFRRRPDGLGDLFALGFTGPDLQAVLSRIRDRSRPSGDDERTAEQRRFDACRDLLLGRDPLPLDDAQPPTSSCRAGGRAACGCWPGATAPCGAELLVHLSIDTALGTSDDPAELVGHGPLDPDLLEQVLLSAPRLRPVWTDEHGAVVAVGDRPVSPVRDDAASVREALLHLTGLPPPAVLHPRHPGDHVPDGSTEGTPQPPRGPASRAAGTHPTGAPGDYRVPRRLRRLLEARSPRCEWPGCGARAVRCDAEHDLAWPAGATCACNLGPCCRRHHRVKQLGWTKSRHQGGITWTSPGRGRSWLSPTSHQPLVGPVRALPALHVDPLDELSPLQREEELWWLAQCPDDPAGLELRATEADEPDADRLGEHLRVGDTRWTLDLDDPYAWQLGSPQALP